MNTITKTFSMFLLAAILVIGTISISISSSFANGFGDSFANDYKKKGSSVNIQKVKCKNTIINGEDKSHQKMPGYMPYAMTADENYGVDEQGQWMDNGEKKFKDNNRNIVNICINKNNIIAVGDDQKDTGQTCTVKTLTKKQIYDINQVLADAVDPITFQVGENIPQPVRMLFALCDIVNNAAGQVTSENIRSFFEQVNTALEVAQQEPVPDNVIRELTRCLTGAGLVEGPSQEDR